MWVVGDRSAASFLASTATMAGAAAVLLLGRDHPVLVVALASASRLVLETPFGTLRLEQPAIGALVVVAAARGRREGRHAPRQVWLIGAAVLVYLAVMTMSSALVAPQPIASLRITLWWAISAAGGAAAFVLLRGRAVAGSDAFYRRRGDLRHRRTGCRTGDSGHAYVPAAGLRPGLGDQPLRELHCGGPHPRGGDLARTARDHGRHGGAPLKSPSLSA